MSIEETMETVPVMAPKALISGPPALSDIFSASEDEHEEEGRDEELLDLEHSEGFFAKRQAPPSNPSDPAGVPPAEWACMHGLFPLRDGSDDSYSWCNFPFFPTADEESTSVPSKGTPTLPETKSVSASPTAVPDMVLDDHKTTGQVDDNESIASVSTVGKIFEDLSSLPSLMADNFPRRKNDVNSTHATASTLSSSSSANQDVVPPVSLHSHMWDDNSTVDSLTSVATDRLDEVIAEKLRQVDADKTIGDTPKSAVALMRSSSSASARSLKRKKAASLTDTKCDQSVLSCQTSHATSVASPRSVSNRTALVRELKSAIEEYGRFHVRCASIACALADTHDNGHDYAQALKLYREATTIYTTKLGDHHATTINAKVQLGKILEKMGDHDRAIELYFSVLSMQKAILGDTHVTIPDTLSHLASALKRKGRPSQSIKELKRALKLYRGSLGDSHPRVAETVDEISSLYVMVGDYDKATAILEEVVKLKAATVGMNHEDVAKTLFELATAYELAGEKSKALRTLKRCFSIQSNIYGDNSDKASMVLERIAQICRSNGDSERAVAAFLGVLRARKDLHGESHPIVADTYLHLGIALRENKQQDKAMKCMKQALSIYVGEGKDMHDVGMIAEVMQEMAFIHRSKGQLNDAIKIFKQVLTIRQKMGEQELHRVADTLFHLGTTELELKNHTKALNFFMEALNIYEKTSNEIGVDFAKTLYCTGIVFDASRHHERAQEAYAEAIKVFLSQGLSDRQVKDIVALLDKLKTSGSPSKRGNRTTRNK
jgi:tetratricopeptide (TPR) repeat protein